MKHQKRYHSLQVFAIYQNGGVEINCADTTDYLLARYIAELLSLHWHRHPEGGLYGHVFASRAAQGNALVVLME